MRHGRDTEETPETFTHIAVPFAGSCKLQLAKGVRWVFRGVLRRVPVVHNRRAEVVAQGNGGMVISFSATLAQGAITARQNETCGNMLLFRCFATEEAGRSIFTIPEGIFNEGGAHSLLDDFGDPALKAFIKGLTSYIIYHFS